MRKPLVFTKRIKTDVRICHHCHRELLLDESLENPPGCRSSVTSCVPQLLDLLILAIIFIAFAVVVVGCITLLRLMP